MLTIKGIRVTPGQKDVYDVLKTYGPLPDHALVPLAQHVVHTPQSSSSIRSRRSELADVQLVVDTGHTIETAHGRKARVYKVVV